MDLRSVRETSARSQSHVLDLASLDEPGFWQRHRVLRWAVPIVAVAALAVGGVLALLPSDDPARLPDRSAQSLLTAVRAPVRAGFTGTLVSRMDTDVATLPPYGDVADPSPLAGSHTLQVWYAAADRQRIAVLSGSNETDVFRNGTDLWEWRSADRTAIHSNAGAPAGRGVPVSRDPLVLTPAALTRVALRAVDASTRVTVHAQREVADRAVYELVLSPGTATTKIASVRIAVDGATSVPIGVQVFARGQRMPSLDVAFTTIHFRVPAATNFRFTPPRGATVLDGRAVATAMPRPVAVVATGTGWAAVLGYPAPAALTTAAPAASAASAWRPVSGAWGGGSVHESDLVSVLVTRDGRVFAGTVYPAALYAAAARR